MPDISLPAGPASGLAEVPAFPPPHFPAQEIIGALHFQFALANPEHTRRPHAPSKPRRKCSRMPAPWLT
jgi:hypothetical protein